MLRKRNEQISGERADRGVTESKAKLSKAEFFELMGIKD